MKKIIINKNIVSTIIFGLFFLILIGISEILYISNNDSIYLRKYYLSETKSMSIVDDSNKALNYLFKATNLRLNNQEKKYSNIFSKKDFKDYSVSILNSDYDKSVYIKYLKDINVDSIFSTKDIDFLRIYYNLALISYKNNYKNDIIPLLKIAMFLEPELSHIHIEIANYYMSLNQKDKALEEIAVCLNLKYPSSHCLTYKNDSLNQNILNEFGFLKNSIDENYTSK